MSVLSADTVRFVSNEECKLVCGRWLIIWKPGQVVSHDISTRSEQVLFEWDVWGVSWDATSCMSSNRGHLLYMGIHFMNSRNYPEGQRMHVLDLSMSSYNLHIPPTGSYSSFWPMMIQDT